MDDTEEQQGSGTGGELNFIRILSQDKSYYERFRPIVQDHLFSEEGLQVIADLDKWFNQGHDEVSDWEDFSSWFFFTQHPNLKQHKAAIYKKLFERLGEDSADESLLEELVETMVKRDYATRICSVAADIADGTDIKTDIDRIEDWCAEYRRELDKALEEDAYIVSEDLEGLLEHTFQGGGYDWRLPELNLACGPVRKGDLIMLAARIETGKTTWLTSETSYMAEQMKNGEQVVWFNNEEEGRKVKLRFFQAVIGWTLEEIRLDPMRAKDEFNRKVGGWDRFVLFDKANIHPREVERVLENSNPGLIVFDQLYKVRGWEKSSGTEVQRLHSIYQFARSLAKEHAPVIATHQAGGDAAGLKWLEDYMLEGCRTNIQSELDLQIMMGKTSEAGYESSRFLNIVKNKLAGGHKSDEAWRHSRHEVIIEPTIGRYRSPTE